MSAIGELIASGAIYQSEDSDRWYSRVAGDVLAEAIADSLDAAWASAEAALPEGWQLEVVHRGALTGDINPWTGYAITEPREQYVAEAAHVWYGGPTWKRIDPPEAKAEGPTPAAALRALTAKLRGEG